MRYQTTTLMAALAALALATAPATAQNAGDPTDAGRGTGSTQTDATSPAPDPRSDQPGRSQMLAPEEMEQIARILLADGAPIESTGIDDVRPGAVIPRTTVMRPVPAEVVEIAPGYAGYSFVALQGQICIVDPQTLVIIAVLPAA
ncbi:DUF1236 domain-containing protein [Pseudoxanthobacter sp. M-2]|uniref:DUF1236 domain-containing protein n=1 Tax=Pseudoxanthobacter sp. M-2 TaxID=3078754 RepID=UPI0038FCCF69